MRPLERAPILETATVYGDASGHSVIKTNSLAVEIMSVENEEIFLSMD